MDTLAKTGKAVTQRATPTNNKNDENGTVSSKKKLYNGYDNYLSSKKYLMSYYLLLLYYH